MSEHKHAPFLFGIEHCRELVPKKIGPMDISQYEMTPTEKKNFDYVLAVTGIENHKDLIDSRTFKEQNYTWREAYYSPLVETS
jgi:hypothetical protein